jgi:hypothetical protein
MSDDLATLETHRSKLLEEFLRLGDLRPGPITAVTRRCGRSSCHCAKHNDPGHDPQFRLTRRVAGEDGDGELSQPHRPAQSPGGSRRASSLPATPPEPGRICRLRPVTQERGYPVSAASHAPPNFRGSSPRERKRSNLSKPSHQAVRPGLS